MTILLQSYYKVITYNVNIVVATWLPSSHSCMGNIHMHTHTIIFPTIKYFIEA